MTIFILFFDQVTGFLPHSSQQPHPSKALVASMLYHKKSIRCYIEQRFLNNAVKPVFSPQDFCHFMGGVRKDLYTKYTRKGPVRSDSMVSPPSLMFLKPLCPEQTAPSREQRYITDYIYQHFAIPCKFEMTNRNVDLRIYKRDSFMALYESPFNKSWRNSFIGSVDDRQSIPFVRHIIFVPKLPVVPSEMGTVSIPHFEGAWVLF